MSDEKQYLKRKEKAGVNENQSGCKITILGMGGKNGGEGGYFNSLAEKERVNNRRSWLGTRGPTSDGFYFNGKKI